MQENTYNPCDDCLYGYSKQNQESSMHKICEFKKYRDLEEQGLLLKLPCKVGDKVYVLAGRFGSFYEDDICDGFYVGRDWILQVKVQNNKGNHGTYGIVNETVFLTKAEAEEALKRMESEHE